MATVYPGGVDSWQDPVDTDALSTSPDGRDHQQHHADLNAVALAMEAQLAGPAFTSAAAYDDVATEVVHSADATSDSLGTWHATNTQASDTPATDASNKTEGSASVTCDLKLPGGAGRTGNLYVDLTTPLDVGGHTAITLDCRFHIGNGNGAQSGFRVVATDGAGLTGTLVSSDITQDNDSEDLWFTMTIPTTGLTSIASVGIEKDPTASGSSSKWVTWWLDNINLRAGTALDSALADVDGAVVVPADLVPSVEQFADTFSAVRSVLDLRPAHANLAGIGGVYNLRDWRLDETGTDDVTEDLQRIFDSLDDATTLKAPSTAIYRIDDTVTIGEDKRQITFDGQGCRFVQPSEVDSAFFQMLGTENTIRGVRAFSLNDQVLSDVSGLAAGDTSHPIVGSPVAVGTTIQLNDIGDQVELAWKGDDQVAFYARNHLGVNSWDFVLSDTNHVASDCKLTVMQKDGTVLQTTLLTLTGTPTTYTLEYTPDNLYIPLRVAISKAGALTNTITLTSLVMYGRQTYDANLALNSMVAISDGSANVRVLDCWAEGMGGDAVAGNNCDGVIIENLTSRVNCRQGVSFNRGQRVTMRNSEVMGAARHSIDMEPETNNVAITDVTFENCMFMDPGLGHVACTAWPRVRRINMRNCDFIATMDGGGPFFTGGWWDGTLQNCTFLRQTSDTVNPVEFTGRAVTISNCVASGGIQLNLSTAKKTEDDVTHTSDYIAVNGWRALNPVGDAFTSLITNYSQANVATLGGGYSLEYPD